MFETDQQTNAFVYMFQLFIAKTPYFRYSGFFILLTTKYIRPNTLTSSHSYEGITNEKKYWHNILIA